MSRPIVRYPVNHHLAQILERAVAMVAVRAGRWLSRPASSMATSPSVRASGPTSAIRRLVVGAAHLLPMDGLELQGSYAHGPFPRAPAGCGNGPAQVEHVGEVGSPCGQGSPIRSCGVARTSEAEGSFVFHCFLAEGAWTRGPGRLHYRFERTERPEEERRLDPFRSVRPHLENSILGITRWTIHTLGYGLSLGGAVAMLRAMPFVEVSYGRMADIGEGLFEVRSFYGRSSFWSLSIGIRVNPGMRMHRMGRYGVLQDTVAPAKNEHYEHHEH